MASTEQDAVQQPSEIEAVTFETDFGLTFGVFVCFDIYFEYPLRTLLEAGVKHFVYPTKWMNQAPFMTGEMRTPSLIEWRFFPNESGIFPLK